MESKDGGPAFPHEGIKNLGSSGTIAHKFPGMTMRDYFAAKAMQGMIQYWSGPNASGDIDDYASDAYRMADAMLRAREGKGE